MGREAKEKVGEAAKRGGRAEENLRRLECQKA